jgi:BirA family biotin operon repressor/biotin-[acetyl-CoA-carboxylase] ligase
MGNAQPRTNAWIQAREEPDEVTSTNDVARTLVTAGTHALPLLVRSSRQTAGRGQRTNAWYSDEGSLTFSLALDPTAHGIERATWPRIALTAAVAIIDTAERLGVTHGSLGIRWPNDVETPYSARKVAGILPESVETPDGPRLVLGIGLNVTTDLSGAPEDVRRMATTLRELVQETFLPPVDTVLDILLESLEVRLGELGRSSPSLATRWSNLDLLRGQAVTIKRPDGAMLQGVVRGIDPSGALRLEMPGGEIRAILAGQVLRG